MSDRKPPVQQVEELLGHIGRFVFDQKVPDELFAKKSAAAPACAKCGTELVELVAGDGASKVQVCPSCSKAK